jgi:vacuolar protein sorting-associated protein 72
MTVSESMDSSQGELEDRGGVEENTDNEEEEEEENSEPGNVVIPMVLERARRENAGSKMKRLLEEEIEVGDEFYEQDMFQEEEDDEDFVESEEFSQEDDDIFDADFLSPEEEEQITKEEEAQEEKRLLEEMEMERRRKPRKPSKYHHEERDDEAARKRTDTSLTSDFVEPKRRPRTPRVDVPIERTVSVRSSTLAKTQKAQNMHEVKAQLKLLRSEQFAQRKSAKEPIVWTQEALLEEAKHTEVLNLASLEDLKRLEIEMKKVPKPYVDRRGPRIIYRSSLGQDTSIEFKEWQEDPFISFKPRIRVKRPLRCAITGLPAKYRDPKTGIPYATKEAYEQLRAR